MKNDNDIADDDDDADDGNDDNNDDDDMTMMIGETSSLLGSWNEPEGHSGRWRRRSGG